MQPKKFDFQTLSISTLWLFHISGILGILYGNSEWFIAATPLNLSLNFVLLLLNCKGHPWFFPMVFLGFITGMTTEILGIQLGWIFGYSRVGKLPYKTISDGQQ
jgi:putative membrane protein